MLGVTISSITGNGIFNKANSASDETRKQSAKEILNLKITNVQIETYTEKQRMPTLKELAISLDPENDSDIKSVTKTSQKVGSLDWINDNDYSSIFTILKDYPEYEFEIDGELRLASINGLEIAKVPESDKDSIISMTKEELQSIIDNSITNSLKEYSKTTDISENYATKEEISVPTLDWNNKINITNNLKTIGGSYTAPKNGIVRVFVDQNNTSNCCLSLTTNATSGNYKKYYANNTTSWATFSDEFQMNKGNSITVASESVLNGFRTFYIEFVPYK